jgi:hypothetical protein
MLFVGFLAIFNVTTSLLTAQHIIAPTLYLGYRAVSTGLYLVGVTTTRASLAEWLWHSAGNAPGHSSRSVLSTPPGFLANCLLIAAAPFLRLLHVITCLRVILPSDVQGCGHAHGIVATTLDSAPDGRAHTALLCSMHTAYIMRNAPAPSGGRGVLTSSHGSRQNTRNSSGLVSTVRYTHTMGSALP